MRLGVGPDEGPDAHSSRDELVMDDCQHIFRQASIGTPPDAATQADKRR